jgi:hypothetical protein
MYVKRERANHTGHRREGALEHRSKGGPLVRIDEEHVRVSNAATQFEYDTRHTEISGSTEDSATFIYPRVSTPEDERSMTADADRL